MTPEAKRQREAEATAATLDVRGLWTWAESDDATKHAAAWHEIRRRREMRFAQVAAPDDD